MITVFGAWRGRIGRFIGNSNRTERLILFESGHRMQLPRVRRPVKAVNWHIWIHAVNSSG